MESRLAIRRFFGAGIGSKHEFAQAVLEAKIWSDLRHRLVPIWSQNSARQGAARSEKPSNRGRKGISGYAQRRGESGIRTLEPVAGLTVFKTVAFDRSANSPCVKNLYSTSAFERRQHLVLVTDPDLVTFWSPRPALHPLRAGCSSALERPGQGVVEPQSGVVLKRGRRAAVEVHRDCDRAVSEHLLNDPECTPWQSTSDTQVWRSIWNEAPATLAAQHRSARPSVTFLGVHAAPPGPAKM